MKKILLSKSTQSHNQPKKKDKKRERGGSIAKFSNPLPTMA